MNINLCTDRYNWCIIENTVVSAEQAAQPAVESHQATESVSGRSLTTISESARSSSNNSKLGQPLNGSDRDKVLRVYEAMCEFKMWKLSIGKYAGKNLNYVHIVCSVILDTNDENWEEYFSAEELDEIDKAAKVQKQPLPVEFQPFVDGISKTTDLRTVISHLNSQIIDPFENWALYWLKKSLQNAADMFITRCLPNTNQQERDIIRRLSTDFAVKD